MTEPDSLRASGSSTDLDPPGVNQLFAVIAYGEVAAFYRLTDESRMAPDLASKIAIASMAASQMRHYEVLRDAMEAKGIDVLAAMEPYVKTLENYHSLTLPRTWLEAMVKAYIGDSPGGRLLWRGCRLVVRRIGRRAQVGVGHHGSFGVRHRPGA